MRREWHVIYHKLDLPLAVRFYARNTFPPRLIQPSAMPDVFSTLQVMPFPEEDETFVDSEAAYRTTRESGHPEDVEVPCD